MDKLTKNSIASDYKISKLKFDELQEALDLVRVVFDEFEKPDYSLQGSENFYKFASYENISAGLKDNLEIFVAKSVTGKIVGMICFRDKCHISLLFVDKNYHRRGIASSLLEILKSACTAGHITVNSSPYATEFYHKMGFYDLEPMKEIDGIKFTNMKLDL